MQFALYRNAVGRQYPDEPQTLLLRIGLDGATLEPVAPASEAALSEAVASARRWTATRHGPATSAARAPTRWSCATPRQPCVAAMVYDRSA